MTQHIYKPKTEKDDGYSIPKILVAVLLLVLIGAGIYIYFQHKKLKTSVSYLLDSKKQVEQDLNQTIERYNLAIDDNSSLEGKLKDKRDFVIQYRDSIRNIPNKYFKETADLKEAVTELEVTSASEFANANTTNIEPIAIETKGNELPTDIKNKVTRENKNEATNNLSVTPNTSENSAFPTNEEKSTDSAQVAGKELLEPAEGKIETKKEPSQLTFSRVEIPPTYPGCSGTPVERKACFSKKIRKYMSKKFDATIVDNLNIESGTKRIWVNFSIDKLGNITNIKARGPHEKLEEEAIRITSMLPKMTPAQQNGRYVKISYSVPITFKIP